MDLLELRNELDGIDKQIVELYEKRMNVCGQVAEYKIETGKRVFDKEREKQKLEAVRALTHNDFNAYGVTELFEQIMAMSRKLQYRLLAEHDSVGKLSFSKVDHFDTSKCRVVFQGAEGAYSQAAMIQYFWEGVNCFHVDTFRDAMRDLKGGRQASTLRTDRDIPMNVVLIGVLIAVVIIWLVPAVPVNFVGAMLIAVFGFLFAAVSSRLVGLVGSSNNPVSGMAIATLLVSALVLKAVSGATHESMMGVISIGGVICVIAAIAGDTSQDLKTGYLVGSTPRNQQMGELIGVVSSAIAIGGVLYLLNQAWGYGSAELPAPQAMIMKTVVEGVMDGNLPWNMILAGAAIAVVIEILGIPVMPVAVGLYLPLRTTAAIMVGGLIRHWYEKRKYAKEEDKKEAIDRGVLYTSGMIAGEGLVGILLAVFAIIPLASARGGYLGDFINLSALDNGLGAFLVSPAAKIVSLIVFGLLMLTMCKFTIWHKENRK